MKILVIDAKAESIQFSVYLADDLSLISYGKVERIGRSDGRITIKVQIDGRREQHVEINSMINHYFGLKKIIGMLMDEHVNVIEHPLEIVAVAHKVAHGGEYYSSPAFVTKELKKRVKRLVQFAPGHNSINLTCIEVCQKLLKGAIHIAVFDTAFHQTIPGIAYKFPIPVKYYEDYGLRVYGTQGIAHEYLLNKTAQYLNKDADETSMISIHIDTECSIAAIKDGLCIDTSGGLYPSSGIMTATDSGDVDPAVLLHLNKILGMKMKEIENVLFNESGMKAVSGFKDIQSCIEEMSRNNPNATLAVEMFCHKIKKHIGMYLALLGTTDVIVFSGRIGEKFEVIRRLSLNKMQNLGVQIDEEKNKLQSYDNIEISSDLSKVKVIVLPSNHHEQIAVSARNILEAIPAE